jgi:hypothetical protein
VARRSISSSLTPLMTTSPRAGASRFGRAAIAKIEGARASWK